MFGVAVANPEDISSSRSGQNRRHVDGCSSFLDRIRHYSYQLLLASITGHRKAGLRTHKTVNHTFGFVHVCTCNRTNTIDSTGRHVKALLNPFNRIRTTSITWPQHECGCLPIRESGEVEKVHGPRCKDGLKRDTYPRLQ